MAPSRLLHPQQMFENLRELWQYRELLLILVRRDIKVRYKNSVLGFGWSLANPLVQVISITLVIRFLSGGSPTNSYHAYVFCATLPWLFFSIGLADAGPSIVAYYPIIRRTYFPRELIPLSAILANLVHFLLSMGVFLVYMACVPIFWRATGEGFAWPIPWTIFLTPIPLFGLLMFLTGISLFLSVWTLQFEDLRFITDSGLKIIYWAMPVLYFTDLIRIKKGGLLYVLYMLNPVAVFISEFRRMALVPAKMDLVNPLTKKHYLLSTSPMDEQEWTFLCIALLTSLAVLLLGHWYFNSRKWTLAERG